MNRTIPYVLAVLAAALVAAASFTPTRYGIVAGSQFWIDGTSTLGAYTCAGEQVSGSGRVDETAVQVSAQITVPVRSFDCGQRRMNRDMRNALKADQHPSIRFSVDRVTVLNEAAQRGGWIRVRAVGRLELAGVERPVTLIARGRRSSGNRVEIEGQHPLRMTDFGVDPPTGLAGLVRARDAVTARFELIAAPQ